MRKGYFFLTTSEADSNRLRTNFDLKERLTCELSRVDNALLLRPKQGLVGHRQKLSV